MKKTQERWGIYGLALLSAVGYLVLGQIGRNHFPTLLALYGCLFGLFFLFLGQIRKTGALRLGIACSVLLQLLLLLNFPNLSDDYHRFLWDGHLAAHGINPYAMLPPAAYDSAEQVVPLAGDTFKGLNTLQRSNYTCYPPFNELFFVFPAFVFQNSLLGNLVLMRLFILLANLGTTLVGLRLLKLLGKPPSNILYFSLNPLVVVELAGNLHFEALMIFFLVLSLYFAASKKHLQSATMLALSVSVKLLPLALLPVFFQYFGWRKWVAFCTVTGGISVLLFLPVLLSGGSNGFFQSLGLYFQNFEFNASVFYLLRQLGFWWKGYDLVETIGPGLSLVTLAIILGLAWLRSNENLGILFESLLLALTTYFLLSTTVHPWYVTTLLALSVFTQFRFAIVWSFAAFLSYSAYSNPVFAENPWWIGVEYTLVFVFLLHDLRKRTAFSKFQEQKNSTEP